MILLRDCLSSPHLRSQKSLPTKKKTLLHCAHALRLVRARCASLFFLLPSLWCFPLSECTEQVEGLSRAEMGKGTGDWPRTGRSVSGCMGARPTARTGAPAPACFDGAVWLFRLWEIMWLSKGQSGHTPLTVLWLERSNYMESHGLKGPAANNDTEKFPWVDDLKTGCSN